MGKLTLLLVSKLKPLVKSNKVVHDGKVLIVAPIDLKQGSTVITPNGIGEIKFISLDWITKKPSHAEVYLYRGYVKQFRVIMLQQYVIFHEPTQQFIKLSPSNYRYIYKHEQEVKYRVTHRLYAQLTEDTKIKYAYVKTLTKQRGGLYCLKVLAKNNLEIKQKK